MREGAGNFNVRLAMTAGVSAAAWSIASVIAFCAGSAAVKLLDTSLPAIELTFFRSLIPALFLVGVWRFAVDLGRARDLPGHALRCALGVTAIFGLLYAVSVIPFALAMLLYISRTLLMPITAGLMLGERSGAVVWGAVILGFGGVLLSSWPELRTPESQLGILAALGAAVASAGSQTAVRRLTATNSVGLIVLIYTAASIVTTLPATALVWVTPPMADWPVLVGLGLCAVAAQLAAARAFALAPVGFLAPFDFLGVPIGALLGWLLFGEVPSWWVAGGSLIVLASAAVVASGARAKRPALAR